MATIIGETVGKITGLFLRAALIMWVWNLVVVSLFGLPTLTYWEAFGLNLLTRWFFVPIISFSRHNSKKEQ